MARTSAPTTKQPKTAPSGPRRGRPRQVPIEEQRERILVAAVEVFASEGFDGATSERIAEVSGVGRPSVYQLFGSKNDVFIAAVKWAIRRMFELTLRSLESTSHLRGRQQAKANVAAYFDLISEEPNTLRIILLADASGDAETREAAKALRRGMQDSIAAYISNTWEGFRVLTPRDANLAASLIASAVESAAIFHMERPDRNTEEIVQFVSDFIWSGVYDLAVVRSSSTRQKAKTKAAPR